MSEEMAKELALQFGVVLSDCCADARTRSNAARSTADAPDDVAVAELLQQARLGQHGPTHLRTGQALLDRHLHLAAW